jgi:hypothetical protein
MNRSLSRLTASCLTLAAVAILAAVPVAAQEPDLDFELIHVEVLLSEGKTSFQVTTTTMLYNTGNLASHLLQQALYYAPIGRALLEEMIEYVQQEHDCWQQSSLNCAAGSCLDITTGLGYTDGHCTTNASWLNRCACGYVLVRTFEPIPFQVEFPTVTIRLDPDGLIDEIDETNNEYVIDLAAVAASPRSWSAIKGLYR